MTVFIILAVLSMLSPLIVNFFEMIYLYFKYKKSEYGKESGNDFKETIFDISKKMYIFSSNIGNIGEFLTFLKLEKLNIYKKLLCNIYLFDENNLSHECDIVMISETGIYVFESKNLSGWIYGREIDKYWKQSILNEETHKNYKNSFLNPILQNSKHVEMLRKYLANNYNGEIYSYIVFSDRCKIKNVKYSTDHATVTQRNELIWRLKKDIESRNRILSNIDIDEIYKVLKKCSAVSNEVKQKHANNINSGAYFLNNKDNLSTIIEKNLNASSNTNILNDDLKKMLKDYRKKQCSLEQVPAYYIFNDETLDLLVSCRPTSHEELKNVKGLNDFKIAKYGEEIIKIINNNKTDEK